MKTLIRTIDIQDENERINVKDHLNGLGFHVLSGPDNTLQVYVISERVPLDVAVVRYVCTAVSYSVSVIWRML